MSDALQLAVIGALRTDPPPVSLAELRKALSAGMVINSIAPVAAAVQSLRYQGKVKWDRLELSDSMLCSGDTAASADTLERSSGAPPEDKGPEDGGDETRNSAISAITPPPSSGPDDHDGPEDEYPGEVNDAQPAPTPASTYGHRGGLHAQASRAYRHPVPAPDHEPEIARLIREEANSSVERRRVARSTATVRQPIECRKFGIPDMDLTEALSSMLSDDPQSIMRAVSRKHPAMWRRVIFLSRALGKTPMQTLYDALERGLDEMEPQQEQAA